jgi:hypothetical protein
MIEALKIYDKMPDEQKDRGSHCKQMHEIFYKLDEEVWITKENF